MFKKTNNDKAVASVYETKDYEKFNNVLGNRLLNISNLSKIKKSMMDEYLFSPITVNEDLSIIDGQHRFKAAKDLDLPINYIICNGYSLMEVQILNATGKIWNMMDHLNSHCELMRPEYLKVRNFMRQFPRFGVATIISILSLSGGDQIKGGSKKSAFKDGTFVCLDVYKSEKIARELMRLSKYTDLFKNRYFIVAYMWVYRNENFNPETFLKKVESQTNRRLFINKEANSENYRIQFEDIFNYRNRNKVSLKY